MSTEHHVHVASRSWLIGILKVQSRQSVADTDSSERQCLTRIPLISIETSNKSCVQDQSQTRAPSDGDLLGGCSHQVSKVEMEKSTVDDNGKR